MRKVSIVSRENEYEDSHTMSYHVNQTGSDNKDLDNNAQFIWAFVQSDLARRFSQVPYMRQFFFVHFAVEHVAAFKNPCFCAGFQSGHYHIL